MIRKSDYEKIASFNLFSYILIIFKFGRAEFNFWTKNSMSFFLNLLKLVWINWNFELFHQNCVICQQLSKVDIGQIVLVS